MKNRWAIRLEDITVTSAKILGQLNISVICTAEIFAEANGRTNYVNNRKADKKAKRECDPKCPACRAWYQEYEFIFLTHGNVLQC